MKNFIQRALTGVVFVVLVAAAICVHPLLFAGFFSIIVGFLIHEFYSISRCDIDMWQRFLGITGGMYLFISSLLFAGDYFSYIVFLPYIIIIIAIMITGLYKQNTNPVAQWSATFFAQLYCAGFLSLLCFIPYMSSPVYNPVPVLMIFIFIWLNDTGAYLIGSWIGKHRLFKRISPRKSWEGFFGGLFVVVVSSLAFSFFYNEMTWYYLLSFAVVTVVFATFGDLIESLIKRMYGVKDSGNILPGHGGMFDRFDSVIFVSPAIYIFLRLIQG